MRHRAIIILYGFIRNNTSPDVWAVHDPAGIETPSRNLQYWDSIVNFDDNPVHLDLLIIDRPDLKSIIAHTNILAKQRLALVRGVAQGQPLHRVWWLGDFAFSITLSSNPNPWSLPED